MDASITITGNVGSEIDVRGGDDWRYASFRLAMTPRTRRPTGWVDGETTWIGISCRQALAENVGKSLVKGDPVVVAGRLRTNRWRDEQGVDHERIFVEAIAVGHDLSRGTATFQKARRQAGTDPNIIVGQSLTSAEESSSLDPDEFDRVEPAA